MIYFTVSYKMPSGSHSIAFWIHSFLIYFMHLIIIICYRIKYLDGFWISTSFRHSNHAAIVVNTTLGIWFCILFWHAFNGNFNYYLSIYFFPFSHDSCTIECYFFLVLRTLLIQFYKQNFKQNFLFHFSRVLFSL